MLRRFFNDKHGSVAVVMALGTMTLVGAVGGALDYARMTERRASLASAVDAAALAAAQANGDYITSLARQVFDANFLDASSVTSFAVNKVTKDGNDLISIEATANVKMRLAQVTGMPSAPVRAIATATYTAGQSSECVVVLDPGANEALALNSDSRINAPNCNIHVNSSANNALFLNANSHLTSKTLACLAPGKGIRVHPGFRPPLPFHVDWIHLPILPNPPMRTTPATLIA